MRAAYGERLERVRDGSCAAVFGSVARGDEWAESDVDVLIELDRDRAMGIFDYARLKLYIKGILEGVRGCVLKTSAVAFDSWAQYSQRHGDPLPG